MLVSWALRGRQRFHLIDIDSAASADTVQRQGRSSDMEFRRSGDMLGCDKLSLDTNADERRYPPILFRVAG